jgi:hypothetical protein
MLPVIRSNFIIEPGPDEPVVMLQRFAGQCERW